MQIRTALTTIALRAAVSAIGGLLVSAFAAGALTLGPGTSVNQLAAGRTISDTLAQLSSAVAGVGLIASVVLFACLVANDVLRAAARWLVAQRRWFILTFRSVTWFVARIALGMVAAIQYVARSAVVVETIWLGRTVGKGLAWALAAASVLGGCALLYFGAITLGLFSIGESTRIVAAMLDDPPRPLTMAVAMGGAAMLMYIGIAAFGLCVWVTYQAARASMKLALRRAGAVGS